jgi:pyruvate,water dikinase
MSPSAAAAPGAAAPEASAAPGAGQESAAAGSAGLPSAQTWVAGLEDLQPADKPLAGGKAVSLAAMLREGLLVPPGLCVLTTAYDHFVETAGLREAIALELGRKRFEDMRFEELWDASLRIRNLFARTTPDPELGNALMTALAARFGSSRCVVRSSAPGEDAAQTSFAGLHESYVNVSGSAELLAAVQRVWASLWTDRALLYRQELGLDVFSSTMAVVVQELVSGEVSGVAFSESPLDHSQAVIEAVWGLNEGLVDGLIEPDRFILDRRTGALLEHHAPVRSARVASAGAGTTVVPLPPEQRDSAPLDEAGVDLVFSAARSAEELFGSPQDMEWTRTGEPLFVLQSRPVSTLKGGAGASPSAEADEIALAHAAGEPVKDERPWYLSLHRSLANLKVLRQRVEEEALPAMEREAAALARMDLESLSAEALADEIARREAVVAHWQSVYYRDFIPLAHGMRLFGEAYNDAVAPKDPFEFMDLLAGTRLMSVDRNRQLAELAARVDTEGAAAMTSLLDDYLDRYGSGPGTPEPVRARERGNLGRLLRELRESETYRDTEARSNAAADREPEGPKDVRAAATTGEAAPPRRTSAENRAQAYLARFSGAERTFHEELLDLARAAYRLRDDDNVYFGRLENHLAAAREVERLRRGRPSGEEPSNDIGGAATEQAEKAQGTQVETRVAPTAKGGAGERDAEGGAAPGAHGAEAVAPEAAPESSTPQAAVPPAAVGPYLKARQLVGQPAGPGLAVGTARVIAHGDDLFAFERGEILVCDALDPAMTFVAPLASAIVERRGGMLIHGAIIAREYGLPCVTGVPAATEVIRTGDLLTVDGYLGIVVVGGAPPV